MNVTRLTQAEIKIQFLFVGCDLGDVIAAWRGDDDASRARVRCASAKFRELAPMLTTGDASFIMKLTFQVKVGLRAGEISVY